MISVDSIPVELRSERRWVCWRNEERGGKPTKVPYNARTGKLASTADARTWSEFSIAVDAAASFDGVGFCLKDSTFCGLDFDGVVAEGKADPYVVRVLELLGNPYAEVTPSGNGLRAFVHAVRLPEGKRKFTRTEPAKYGAEVYVGTEGGRYLTCTGVHFSGNGVPSPDQKLVTLAWFLASQILNDKFKRLWTGDTSEYDGDESRADLALMGMLARLLKRNADDMLYVFSMSTLGQRDKWREREDYRRRTIERALAGTSAPAESLVGQEDPRIITLSCTGNADLAALEFGKHALYCKELDQWYLADQTGRWSPDRTGRILELVQAVMYARWYKQSQRPDADKAAFRWALESLKHPTMSKCVATLEFRQKLNVLPEQLDADPLLLGVQNGILSLATGELVPPRLDLLVTKCAPVRFDPDAKCDRWFEYLERVQPKEENRQFLQRLAGSLLTGLQPEQCFIFFYGEGANGKSVFLLTLDGVLGRDYSFKARKQLIFLPDKRSGSAQPNDRADLAGKRLITSTEQVGKNWNLEFIKDYTGGEPQHARQLYQHGMNFRPSGKIIVSANEEPTLNEFDEALRRRFIVLPWDVVIPMEERVTPIDLYVASLLRDDGASGILNWALEGLCDLISRNWRLAPPEAAVVATEEYIGNEDRASRFFKDWFETGITAHRMTTKELRKYFVAWLDEPDKFVMSPHSFTKECKRIFKKRCHVGHGNFFVVDDLRFSERGRMEYEQREKDLFTGQEKWSAK
jgi:putative DNA primase/helicase